MAVTTVVFDVGETSERRDVLKPDAGFFQHIVEHAGVPAAEIVYVGDRVDNDVLPASAAGLKAMRIRRRAHAAHATPRGVPEIATLAKLPEALDV